ncbi:hypothetical protein [Paenibacillus eucommiae]|uniref:Uncharacterized protein n=1 Tax=Paenibacillus eucommiae TaxID=1355755 RepID=A0ABS4IUI6_9BACL|nr:hypothetical protein [Paenibacillus eucommiae]MBP1991234.1 hypothetical protein [Paenibacillus eucommiae]
MTDQTRLQSTGDWEVLFPVDGDMLHDFDGEVREGHLHIHVSISAPGNQVIKVNGIAIKPYNEEYYAEIALESYKNVITIEDESRREELVVYWLKGAANKYRLSIDDNIWFLKDIAEHRDTYRSIFDNPYLGFLKEVHDTYGTKVHLNLYFQTDGFDLTQMPDTYKDEWKAQADWLRLTFHALQNEPDMPYKEAGPAEIRRDYERVTNEIIRFAGAELLDPVTTIHWGEATLEGCRELRQLGFRGLTGYFYFVDDRPLVSYYLNKKQIDHLNGRDFWMDHSEDLIFIKIDAVLDRLQMNEIVPALQRLKHDANHKGFLELMIHEQYFYPHYFNYQPDYKDKIFAAAKWASENGYEPAFPSECIFE